MNLRVRSACLQVGGEITPVPPWHDWVVMIQCSWPRAANVSDFPDEKWDVKTISRYSETIDVPWERQVSLQGPVLFGLCEVVLALKAQWNITRTKWSVCEPVWGLQWSGERRKTGKPSSILTEFVLETQPYQCMPGLWDRVCKVRCALQKGKPKSFCDVWTWLLFKPILLDCHTEMSFACSECAALQAQPVHPSHTLGRRGTSPSSWQPGYVVPALGTFF